MVKQISNDFIKEARQKIDLLEKEGKDIKKI